MKRALRDFATLLIILLGVGCQQTPQPPTWRSIDFHELVANPQRYSGSEVCTEGVYATGFETSALGISTYEVGEAVYPSEPTIWIEGAEIRARGACLQVESLPQAQFCPVEACGIFESGGGFGHLGAYRYQLRGTKQ
jgi:hypothetical protein